MRLPKRTTDSYGWKSHGGFASIRTGKCFIEGDIPFIGKAEREELGQLKNGFLNYLSKLPQWSSMPGIPT